MARAEITAYVRRGPDKGSLLVPHRFADGKYVVSHSRFESDQVRVEKGAIPEWIERGFGLRMSDPVTHKSPRLIGAQIRITRV